MQKDTIYRSVIFGTEVLEAAVDAWKAVATGPITFEALTVAFGNSSWTFDNFDEFFGAHREERSGAHLQISTPFGFRLVVQESSGTTVRITAPDRATIQRLSGIFDNRVKEFTRVHTEPEPQPPTPPRVFLGHGRSQQWRDLKDHLHHIHGYEVEAYEVGARAGHVIRDILEEMLTNSSFAVLIMTGEDETADGGLRTRQNVVHETGLFQGKLGFARALVLLEDGTEDYSNLQGVQQIRYSKGNIKETYGEVLGVLRREFGQ